MERLPILLLDGAQHDHIGKLAQQITEKAKQCYAVRRKTTHRVESDLGAIEWLLIKLLPEELVRQQQPRDRGRIAQLSSFT